MKLSKAFSVIAIAMVLILAVSNVAFAGSIPNPSGIKGTFSGTSSITTFGQKIIGVIQTVGSIASVLVLVVIGVKYMMGSTEEKAEYKKTLLPYVIGAVLVFAASNIAGIVFSFASTV